MKCTKASWGRLFFNTVTFSAVMSEAHFFTTESLPVYRTNCSCTERSGLFWNKSHLLISMATCSSWSHSDNAVHHGSDILFIWEKGKQRGFRSIFILSSVLFICMGLECTSVCVCVSACFQAAEKPSRGWRQADDLGSACVYRCVKCLLVTNPMRLEDVAARVRGHATRQQGKPRKAGGLVGRCSARLDDRNRNTRSSLGRCFCICRFKHNLPVVLLLMVTLARRCYEPVDQIHRSGPSGDITEEIAKCIICDVT